VGEIAWLGLAVLLSAECDFTTRGRSCVGKARGGELPCGRSRLRLCPLHRRRRGPICAGADRYRIWAVPRVWPGTADSI